MAKSKKKGKRPDLRKQVEKEKDKLVRKACEIALNTLIVIPLYVLRTEFGFGKERGQRFAREFKRIHTAVAKGEVSIETLKSELQWGMDIEADTDWSELNG